MKTLWVLLLLIFPWETAWTQDRILSPYEQLVETEKKAASDDLTDGDLEILKKLLIDPRVAETQGLDTRIRALIWTAQARRDALAAPRYTPAPEPEKQLSSSSDREVWLALALGSGAMGIGFHFAGQFVMDQDPQIQGLTRYASWGSAALTMTFALIFVILDSN